MTEPLRPNSFREQVQNWLDHATPEQRSEFFDALDAICTNDPRVLEPWHPTPLHDGSNRIALQLADGLVLVWARLADYPGFFNVIYVGRLF